MVRFQPWAFPVREYFLGISVQMVVCSCSRSCSCVCGVSSGVESHADRPVVDVALLLHALSSRNRKSGGKISGHGFALCIRRFIDFSICVRLCIRIFRFLESIFVVKLSCLLTFLLTHHRGCLMMTCCRWFASRQSSQE